MRNKTVGFLCYLFVNLGAMLAFGGVLIHTGNVIEALSVQRTAYIKQIA